MRSPYAERETERLIEVMLPDVAFDGWTRHALRNAARRADIPVGEAMALFPRGAPDLIAEFSRWADRAMLTALTGQDLPAMKVRERIAAAARARLAVLEPHREAVRRALSLLALPHNVPLSLKLL